MRLQLAQLGGGAHALAIQILGNVDNAADAVHDAFATALARPDAFDDTRGSLKPWFLTVVRNRCRRRVGVYAGTLSCFSTRIRVEASPSPSPSATGNRTIDTEFCHLGPETQRIVEQLGQEERVPPRILADELESYALRLGSIAHREFFDLETAKRVTELCRGLLKALPVDPGERQHHLTQIAVSYFVLEEDAEDDNDSLIGFDDDLQVAVAVIKALGLDELLD